jgi:hypothetical protein
MTLRSIPVTAVRSVVTGVTVKQVFWLSIVVRLPLLLLAPVSLLDDGMQRYIPEAISVTHLNFSFADPPVYPILLSIPALILRSSALYLVLKLISLGFWTLLFWQANTLLERLSLEGRQRALTLLIFSFLSWPLLVSVSILPDTLLCFLFIAAANRVVINCTTTRQQLELAGLILLLVATNPMGFIVAPSLILFAFLRTDGGRRALTVIGAYALAAVAYTPWLIKIKLQNNVLVGSALTATAQATVITPISLGALPHQLMLAFSYFWEFPSYDKITGTHFAQAPLTVTKYLYFAGNFAIFIAFSGLLAVTFIRAGKNRYQPGLDIAVLAAAGLIFSVAYWPFFAKYDYWDTGRYSFIVMVLLLALIPRFGHFNQRWLNYAATVTIIGAIGLSVINSTFIVLEFNQLQRQLSTVLAAVSGSNQYRLLTNDAYTQVFWQFSSGRSVTLDSGVTSSGCESIQATGPFALCIDRSGHQIRIVRAGGTSRNTG